MASLQSVYIKAETLKTLHDTLLKKGEKGIELTVSISDEGNNYNQNVSAFVSQSKEDREAKKPRFYVGNGKTFWTDGKISVIQDSKPEQQANNQEDDESDPLPF